MKMCTWAALALRGRRGHSDKGAATCTHHLRIRLAKGISKPMAPRGRQPSLDSCPDAWVVKYEPFRVVRDVGSEAILSQRLEAHKAMLVIDRAEEGVPLRRAIHAEVGNRDPGHHEIDAPLSPDQAMAKHRRSVEKRRESKVNV